MAVLALLVCIVLLDNSIFYSVNITSDTKSGSVVRPGDTLKFSADCAVFGIHFNKSSALEIKTNSSKSSSDDNGCIVISKDALSGEEITVNVSYNSKIRNISQNYNYLVKYSLESSIEENGIISAPERIDVLVNKSRFLSKNYIPADLIKVNVKFLSQYNKMQKVAASALENLYIDAKKTGIYLVRSVGIQIIRCAKKTLL